jgi:5-methylcytosine-specific restriction endonuclease McrA
MERVNLNNPIVAKERNLLKGAIRRVFSRSKLRRQVIEAAEVKHTDPLRPRVTKWVFCAECGEIFPRYLAEVDHINPVIKPTERLEDLTWSELVDRIWCNFTNLRVVDKDCHRLKTKNENKLRKQLRLK